MKSETPGTWQAPEVPTSVTLDSSDSGVTRRNCPEACACRVLELARRLGYSAKCWHRLRTRRHTNSMSVGVMHVQPPLMPRRKHCWSSADTSASARSAAHLGSEQRLQRGAADCGQNLYTLIFNEIVPQSHLEPEERLQRGAADGGPGGAFRNVLQLVPQVLRRCSNSVTIRTT